MWQTSESQPECSIHSLPTETVCSILKTLLYVIIEDDMMRTPEAKHRVVAGGLPFPHTMALVCRHWRGIVSSTPELWTRIFCVLPQEELQWMSSQLKKTVRHPIHLTILHQHGPEGGIYHVFRLIAPHLQRLRSIRIHKFHKAYDTHHRLDRLIGYAPQLEFLRLTVAPRDVDRYINPSYLELDCPALRILHVNKGTVCDANRQWLQNNLAHVEHMTISSGSGHPPMPHGSSDMAIAQALGAVPWRIPCLTLHNLNLPRFDASWPTNVKFGAKKVILHIRIDALAANRIDDNCQTIVLHHCNSVRHLHGISLPSFNSLELDGCTSKSLQHIPRSCAWDGNTVTITNSHYSCIKIILYLLGAPFKRQRCSMWPRVTTLKLVAKGDFDMELPLTLLQMMISSRREAAGQENLGKDEEELNSMGFEGVRPLMVLHVQGGQRLPHKEKVWFEEQVRDFVWDHKKM